jgi:hypothetical protein
MFAHPPIKYTLLIGRELSGKKDDHATAFTRARASYYGARYAGALSSSLVGGICAYNSAVCGLPAVGRLPGQAAGVASCAVAI